MFVNILQHFSVELSIRSFDCFFFPSGFPLLGWLDACVRANVCREHLFALNHDNLDGLGRMAQFLMSSVDCFSISTVQKKKREQNVVGN